MNMTVTELDNKIKQIKLDGRLDIPGTSKIEQAFTTQSAVKKGAVIVDLTAVTFVASYGIRILVSNAKALSTRGGKMVLYNPSSIVKEALVMAGIDQLIPTIDDFDVACQELASVIED